MPRIETLTVPNPNGSKTKITRVVESIRTSTPYAEPVDIILQQKSVVRWPKAKDALPNAFVPSKSQRRVLLKEALAT